ncbi:hypothetical protein AB0L04_29540, partial [Streptomyces glaucescens]|uniref:hypothetical protein n=1 Tax=Streptomyces glaucescens TaxID=1907 RepID=UPI0034510EBC
RLYQIFFRSDFLGAFQVPASAFPFPAVPTLSELPGRFDQPLVSDIYREWLRRNRMFREADRFSKLPTGHRPVQATV